MQLNSQLNSVFFRRARLLPIIIFVIVSGSLTACAGKDEVQTEVQNITEDTCINIFLPTTPNPTSGYLVFILREEIIRVDMTVEDAMKLIISGAAYLPEPAENSADTAAPPQAS